MSEAMKSNAAVEPLMEIALDLIAKHAISVLIICLVLIVQSCYEPLTGSMAAVCAENSPERSSGGPTENTHTPRSLTALLREMQ